VEIQETMAALATSTFTPTPTNSVTPSCVTSDEYKSKIMQYMSVWNASLVDYSNQTKVARANTALIHDNVWLNQTSQDLASIKQVTLEVQQLKPPVNWAAVDTEEYKIFFPFDPSTKPSANCRRFRVNDVLTLFSFN
jgi:hypothetical protein